VWLQDQTYDWDQKLALFPGLHIFQWHEECGGPGIFLTCDVKDIKVAGRTYLNVGALGLRAARRAKVPEMHLASGRQLLYTLSVEPAVH